jgi:hypothetical protein
MAIAKASGIDHCCDAIRRDFTEQPGLRLTLLQAQRLSGTTALRCRRALDLLVEDGFLIVTWDGQYCRRDFYTDTDADADGGVE